MDFKQLVFPDKCIVCRQIINTLKDELEDKYVCNRCKLGIMQEHICKKCGKPYAIAEENCIYCDEMPREVTQIIGLFPYQKQYKASILRWKYQGIRKYGRGFANLFATYRLEETNIQADWIIPIPIAPRRYRKRGFNQAEDFAYELGKLINIPVEVALTRVKNTKPQAACTKEERSKNIHRTIRCCSVETIKAAKTIILVDDIYTTGSTIRECIRAIMEVRDEPMEAIYIWVVGLGI